eukprot:816283-Karenia_brevis.AAC.1
MATKETVRATKEAEKDLGEGPKDFGRGDGIHDEASSSFAEDSEEEVKETVGRQASKRTEERRLL